MLHVVLLAGGQGRRMRSLLPKVLHIVGGKPLLTHVIETALQLRPDALSVIYGNDQVPTQLSGENSVHWVLQNPSLGTGDAIAQILPYLTDEARVLILPGDTPLIDYTTLESFIRETCPQTVGLITAEVDKPIGLGRVIRNTHRQVINIIEEADANLLQKEIHEINSGVYLVAAPFLKRWIPQLSNKNAQQEYYLTDIIGMAVQDAVPVTPFCLSNTEEIQGVNNSQELALVEQVYQRRQANHLLAQGLQLKDPRHFWSYGTLQFGGNVTISHNVTLEGNVQIGDNVYIGPYSLLTNVIIGSNVTIKGFCVIKDAVIQKGANIGPFAHVHDQVTLMDESVVGNFVEVTRSHIGKHSKIKHLSYLGDVVMGSQVNIGAGTITCNYDGIKKHRTYIEDQAHIGAQTAIIAPATIGTKATIGAGSVIKSAPAHQLTLSRAKQVTVENWKRPNE